MKPHKIFQITDTRDLRARVALRPRPKKANNLTRRGRVMLGDCG